MTQIFECPQCHDEVKPDHIACYSCGMTAEVRPTVVTGSHQLTLSEAIEAVDDALGHLINHQLNNGTGEHISKTVRALKDSKKHLSELYKEFCGAS